MRYGIFFEHSTTAEQGILLPNHMASSLQDATGDRAQYLSQILHMPVLAFERPSTADLTALPQYDTKSYLENVSTRAEKLQKLMGDFGIERFIACGNSVGALDSIALAASGKVAINKVVAIDPIGLKNVPRHLSYAAWMKEQLKSGKTEVASPEFKSLDELGDIRQPASKSLLARRIFKETRTYGPVCRTNVGVQLLRKMANKYPQITVNLVLAEHSFVSSPEVLDKLSQEFADTSVNVQIIPDSTHAFADRHQHFMYVVQKALGLYQGR